MSGNRDTFPVGSSMMAGVMLVAAAVLGLVFNQHLQELLATPYPSAVRRAREATRIAHYPYAALFLGATLIAFDFIRRKAPAFPLRRLPRLWTLAGVVFAGILLSQREWNYFGRPFWDGYYEFSSRIFGVISNPGAAALSSLKAFARDYIHVSSPLGPLAVALMNLLVRNLALAYMVTMLLATLASGYVLRRILVDYYGIERADSWDYLILFFSHFAVARSSYFPQMDAMVMCFSTFFLWAMHRYFAEGRAADLALLSAVASLSLYTKVSAFFLLPLPIGYFTCRSLIERSFRLRQGAILLLSTVALPVGLFALYLWGFGLQGNFAEELGSRHAGWWALDYNPKKFVVTFFFSFQMYSLLALDRQNFSRPLALIPLLHVAVTSLALVAGSAAFWCRFLLPLVPSMVVLSTARLERIRSGDPTLLNFILLSHVAFNWLFLMLRLYH